MEAGKGIDRENFAKVMAYIAAGIQQPITDAGMEVYYDLLGDLTPEVLAVVGKRAILEHKYATFPPVATLREFAADAMTPPGDALQAGEAWALAWAAACAVDPGNNAAWRGRDGKLYDDETAYRMAMLPELVAEAVRRIGGLKLLANSDGKFAREPFLKAYAEVTKGGFRHQVLTAPVREQLNALSNGAIAAIGVEK